MLGFTENSRRHLAEIVILSIAFTTQIAAAETSLSERCGALLFPAELYSAPTTDQDTTIGVSRRKGGSFTDERVHVVRTKEFFIQLTDTKKAFAIYELHVDGQKPRRVVFL